jgi:DinB family protein
MQKSEVWLRGPVENMPAMLQPVAHSLLQSREEIEALLATMTPGEIWRARSGAASVGFHVLHAIGSLDRLFTYARGAMLSDSQRHVLERESHPDQDLTADDLLAGVGAAVERALEQLRSTDQASLGQSRLVGRAQLPSTALGLLFHAAEHTQRHVGQAVTTRKLLAAEG